MKRISMVAVLLVLFVIGCASTSNDAGPAALDAAWMKAFKAGDLEGVMACYAPDAVDWEPGAPEARGEAARKEEQDCRQQQSPHLVSDHTFGPMIERFDPTPLSAHPPVPSALRGGREGRRQFRKNR